MLRIRTAKAVLRPFIQLQRRGIADFSILNEIGQKGSNNKSSSSGATKNGTDSAISETVNKTRATSKIVGTSPVPEWKDNKLDGVLATPPYDPNSAPLPNAPVDNSITNWSSSFHGLGGFAFSKESQEVLYAPLATDDIEITPDGLLYLPEIKYRRVLNRAFGAGAWGMAPRSEVSITKNDSGSGGLLSREFCLVVHGRLVSIARGEQTFFNDKGIATATEGCKSNALMRCCKDLGIASELWDPRFIKKFKKANCEEVFVEYVPTKKKKKIWKRKDEDVEYPFKR